MNLIESALQVKLPYSHDYDILTESLRSNGPVSALELVTVRHPTRGPSTPLDVASAISSSSRLWIAIDVHDEFASVGAFGHHVHSRSEAERRQSIQKCVFPYGQTRFRLVGRRRSMHAWSARAEDGGHRYVALFHVADKSQEVSVPFHELGIAGTAGVRNLWSDINLGPMFDRVVATLPAHGSALFRLD